MSDEEAIRRFKAAVVDVFPFEQGESFEVYCRRAAGTLKIGQRAMLMARLEREMRAIAKERQQRKNAWIAEARASFMASPRSACFVCGRFRDIAHAHHVVPLAAQFDRGFAHPDHEHEWLCPNHHAIVHTMIPPEGEVDAEKVGRRVSGELAEMELHEINLLLDLVKRSGRLR